MFGGSFPFTIYHFPFRPAFFSGLLEAAREPMKLLPPSFLDELDAQAAAYLANSDPIRQSGFGGGAERWRAEREPILDGVNGSGAFVDLGCANGYLLECLVDWGRARALSLIPYGVDHSAALIDLARIRFPGLESHFVVANSWWWRPAEPIRFVYTLHDAVPRDYLGDYLKRLLEEVVAPGGRLIVGAYGSRSRGLAAFHVAQFMRELQMSVAGQTTGGNPPIVNIAWADRAAAA
jgi:SAM-dependent methyltransferase